MANSKKDRVENPRAFIMQGLIWAAVGLFSLVCLAFHGRTGWIGAALENLMYGLFGIFAWPVGVLCCVIGFMILKNGKRPQLARGKIILWSVFAFFTVLLYHTVIADLIPGREASIVHGNNYWRCIVEGYARFDRPVSGAGLVGSLITWPVHLLIDTVGAVILSVAGLLATAALLLRNIPVPVRQEKPPAEHAERPHMERPQTEKPQDREWDIDPLPPPTRVRGRQLDRGLWDFDLRDDSPRPTGNKSGKIKGDVFPLIQPPPPNEQAQEEPIEFQEEAPVKRTRKSAGLKKDYKLPRSLLSAPPQSRSRAPDTANARLLEQTLAEFDVQARVVDVKRGPVITRYELQPAPGVRVNSIARLTDDLSMRLATAGVRIEAPVPGKNVVGIEVPNREVETVSLGELIETPEFAKLQRLPLALGRDIAGNPIVGDLTRMPHLLIAGQTGSGKSVCINSIIISLLYRVPPEKLKMILVDPKVVELAVYRDIPHLTSPVVTDPKKAAGALAWAVAEMERRYRMFGEAGVREIEGYNRKLQTQQQETQEKALPYLVVIVDEMADLMMVAPKDVEESVCRIAQLGRAAGVHLIVATQRPSVNVITGLIKANLPSRIAFATASQIDSRTILDYAGAEKLLGRGDMLYYPSGAPKSTRVQGCYVSDADVEAVVSHVKNILPEVEYDEAIAAHEISINSSDKGDGDEDDLLPEAAMAVAETGEASVSLLQRRLRIGYARAGRLIDILEAKGCVGPKEGTKARVVLISREQARLMKEEL
ncbi:MAG: DNA translocase FtsK [Clostridia bacterium]|nr:DNA translocase FtsK [Clostridia bacterium]